MYEKTYLVGHVEEEMKS